MFFKTLSVYNSTFIRQAINGANLVGCDVKFVEVKSVVLEFRASFQTCPVEGQTSQSTSWGVGFSHDTVQNPPPRASQEF